MRTLVLIALVVVALLPLIALAGGGNDYGHDSYSEEDDYGHGHKGGYGKKKHHKRKSYGGHNDYSHDSYDNDDYGDHSSSYGDHDDYDDDYGHGHKSYGHKKHGGYGGGNDYDHYLIKALAGGWPNAVAAA